jgi:dienelactone hydrolase
MIAATLAMALLLQEPGKTEVIKCAADPAQTYACYVPKAYHKAKKWPILYCYSPNAQGGYFVDFYRDVCEEVGWIVVGSNNSQNGPGEPIQAAMKAMWADTHAKFNLDDRRVFASGFSGGARVSFWMASTYPENFAGVVAIGAGTGPDGKVTPKGMAIWLMCGETDPNFKELEALDARLTKEGFRHLRKAFPGGHIMPSKDLGAEAIRWMAKEKPPLAKPNPAEAKKAFEAGEKALADKSPKKAIASFQKALILGDEELQKGAMAKLDELDQAAEALWKDAEGESDRSKKRSLLTKIKTDYDGLDISKRAADELKKVK